MGYTEPKTDWDEDYIPTPEEFNKIESNIKAIKSEAIDFDGPKTFNDKVIIDDDLDITDNLDIGGALVVTGNVSGAFGSFPSGVNATTINTGQGANDVYPMDQGTLKNTAPEYAGVFLTGSIQPDQTPANSQVVLTTGVAVFLPRGIVDLYGYSISPTSTGPGIYPTASVVLSVLIKGIWHALSSSSRTDGAAATIVKSGLVSDGANYKITAVFSGALSNAYYDYTIH